MKRYEKRGCGYVEVRPDGTIVGDKVAQDDSLTEPTPYEPNTPCLLYTSPSPRD